MTEQHILQVSELTKKVKFMLESELNTVWLCGEISNFIAASSGHWYLSLKDNKSQVKCAMFKGNNRRSRVSPHNGQQVLVRAKVSLYEPRGDFQIIIELMEDAGEGLLRQQYEQLKQKLNAQGLFSQQFKQPIPKHILCVGVVTSPTGAAIKDILSVLKRRNSAIKVIIYPTLVQGVHAKVEIEQAIDIANQREECDVLIVGRGGGSLEDLWPFNEEIVVNSIFHSRIPIISAIGHEIDTTLSDYVADLRAPTPSAAAEILSQDLGESVTQITNFTNKIKQHVELKLSTNKQKLNNLNHRLSQTHPIQKIEFYQQRSDELNLRLLQIINQKTQLPQVKTDQLTKRLLHFCPYNEIVQQQVFTEKLMQRLSDSVSRIINNKQAEFAHNIEQLHLVSPLATLARGYSVTRNQQEDIIRSVSSIRLEQYITVQVQDGSIEATVKGITPTSSIKH